MLDFAKGAQSNLLLVSGKYVNCVKRNEICELKMLNRFNLDSRISILNSHPQVWTKSPISSIITRRYCDWIFWRTKLANIKSAIKRNKQNEKKRVANRIYRGSARTFITVARKAVSTGAAEDAKEATATAISSLDKAVAKGVIHKNNAARRKSRLMKHLAALAK